MHLFTINALILVFVYYMQVILVVNFSTLSSHESVSNLKNSLIIGHGVTD